MISISLDCAFYFVLLSTKQHGEGSQSFRSSFFGKGQLWGDLQLSPVAPDLALLKEHAEYDKQHVNIVILCVLVHSLNLK